MIHDVFSSVLNGSKTQTTSTLLVYVKHIKLPTKHGKEIAKYSDAFVPLNITNVK
jgi:hypothetical protein